MGQRRYTFVEQGKKSNSENKCNFKEKEHQK